MNKKKVAVTLAVVFIAGTAMASLGDEGSAPVGPEPTPVIVYVTPEPTPAPTPEPTLEPDIASYLAYLSWGLDYFAVTGEKLDDITAAFDALDDVEANRISRDLLSDFEAAERWLTANPPAACYAVLHAAQLETINHFIKAYQLQGAWLDVYPFGTEEDFDLTMREMNAGIESQNRASDITPTCGDVNATGSA